MFNSHKMMSTPRLMMALIFVMICSGATALNDPTRPSAFRSTESVQSLQLESVLISDTRKIAVISGNVVTEGESVKGFTVIKINKDSVKGQSRGEIVTLTLGHAEIRRKN